MDFSIADLLPDITFKTSRSGGKGGQNVNKVSSKVELNFNFSGSKVFRTEQKELIRQKLANRITASEMVQVICEEERSQLINKERCLNKLMLLLKNALIIPKTRKATRPKKSAIENRLKRKQQQALKKLQRRKDFF